MRILVALTLFMASNTIFACEINLYKYIYKINNGLDTGIIKNTTCNQQVNQKILSFLEGINGKVSANIIKLQIANSNLVITPHVTHIVNLSEIVNEAIEMGENRTIKDLKSLTNINQIQSDTELLFKTDCDKCHSNLGETNLKLILNDKVFWLTGNVFRKALVWVANTRINAFNKNLSNILFDQKIVYLDKEIDTFQDVSKIKFYQLTKSMNHGDVLTTRHLTPLRLVKAFDNVSLKVSGSSLQLATSAKATKSGFYDEFIEVTNLKSNKKFLAKVIDFNTVEIEL